MQAVSYGQHNMCGTWGRQLSEPSASDGFDRPHRCETCMIDQGIYSYYTPYRATSGISAFRSHEWGLLWGHGTV
eukprot:7887828-Pyramimonas_sp.AAC.1